MKKLKLNRESLTLLESREPDKVVLATQIRGGVDWIWVWRSLNLDYLCWGR